MHNYYYKPQPHVNGMVLVYIMRFTNIKYKNINSKCTLLCVSKWIFSFIFRFCIRNIVAVLFHFHVHESAEIIFSILFSVRQLKIYCDNEHVARATINTFLLFSS